MKYIINSYSIIFKKIATLILVCFLSGFLIIINTVHTSENFHSYIKKSFNDIKNETFKDDTILVTLKNNSSLKRQYTTYDFPNLELSNVTNITSEFTGKDDYFTTLSLRLSNPSKKTVIEYINLLQQRDNVYSAEPNYIGEFSSVFPNDPFASEQWALNNIDLPKSWDKVTGSSSIKVGIVDSGIDKTHPDLINRVNQELSADFTGGNNPWANGNYHGTHVAGIVGAQGNNSKGCVGVNWDVELVSLKVGDKVPTSEAVAKAITYAQKHNIKILNLSASVSETVAMNNAIDLYDGIIICASGNSGSFNVGYPARLNDSKIISVGSLEPNNMISSFSNWGKVDVWAPGGHILNTIPFEHCMDNNVEFADGTRLCEFSSNNIEKLNHYVDSGTLTWEQIINKFEELFECSPSDLIVIPHKEIGYHYLSGTSMAAPYVAGVAALMLALDSDMNVQQIRSSIINGAENIYVNMPNNSNQTIKKLNAYNAINYALLHYHQHSYIYSQTSLGHVAMCTECGHTATLSHVFDQHYCIYCNAYTTMHDFDRNYEWLSYTKHNAECCCGKVTSQGHAVSINSYNNGKKLSTCLLCGGFAEMGFIQYTINSSAVTKVTINGSYILPNGVIVLENDDFEAYLNGNLIFYDKNLLSSI